MRNGVSYEPDPPAVQTFDCQRPGCGNPIFIASVRRHDGEIRRVPIDRAPTPDGNVVFELWETLVAGQGLRGHYLVQGEQATANRYTSHHKTCKGRREERTA